MSKYLRPAFLLLDTLHPQQHLNPRTKELSTKPRTDYYSLFPMAYRPLPVQDRDVPPHDLARMPPLSSRPLQETARLLERLYYAQSAKHFPVSRVLDPALETFWLCHYVLSFLARRTAAGEGLRPALQSELQHLKTRYTELKALNKHARTHQQHQQHRVPPLKRSASLGGIAA
eukprot:CAMPEP_0173330382 /NCGR_PEP_ID=MMETSP1144-20121109/3219_1 /TAXON_ID=483371 /ORGANISM="non described non described, Strain CCMP2298" /LENGTH=172 /DNA_ID=CAMNT_0014275055 /DNA_START=126 /DNA_END=641 /DNA_ORIENTATION=-